MELKKTLRWFGAKDAIGLSEIAQTGATGIVTALHHIPNGDIWSVDEILKTKQNIESHGLSWDVVESLPVHEDIKKGNLNRTELISNYKKSIENLGACGIKTICYNFMPVLDWARTDINFALENGTVAMYFQRSLFAAFDLFILKRPNAEKEYSQEQIASAKEVYSKMSDVETEKLTYNIIVATQSFVDGLVGEDEPDPKKIFLRLLKEYDGIDKEQLRENFSFFLNEVIPVAEKLDVNLAVHPDDPPFPLLGLPRIVSGMDDFEWLTKTCPSLHNGITFCTGSLGASIDNNLVTIFESFADRIHFLHLRSTQIMDNGDFYEANHLKGNANMPKIMNSILTEQQRRINTGRKDYNLPMRPDHGHKILDDFDRKANPGYPLIGRLKGLSEISGLEAGIKHMMGH